jgi:hypothetical protein
MPPTPSPTYERLRDYIAKRIRMSHVYQPLMLMELLGRRSPAPAQDVARRILGKGVTQIEYYTERVKRMVGKVLTGNGITRYNQGAYGLVGGIAEGFCAAVELSDAGTWPKASVAEPLRKELLQLCRQRLDAFRGQRGEEVGCLLTQKPAASGTGAATAPRSAARSKSGCSPARQGPLRMLRRRLLLGKPRTSGSWRWTISCPGTRAARTTSATCRHSASPMPIQVRCFQRRGSWRPCRAITRISVPCTRK